MIKMESKLDKILEMIHDKTNPDKIFIDEETYTQVIIHIEGIDKLWHTIKNHSENMKYVYDTLIQIEDLININIRHFDNKTFNSDISAPYPAVGRTFRDGKPYIYLDKMNSSSKTDTDSVLKGAENKKGLV